MRNFFSLLLLGSLAVFFAGCGDPDATTAGDEPAAVTVRGTLQSLGNVHFSAKATHLLRREEGGILYVYSPLYNLNDSDYLNRSVEVTGPLYLPDDTSTKETLKIEALRVLQADELTERPVVRGAYVHPSLGFQWTVRSDWAIDEISNRVTFTAPEPVAAEGNADRTNEAGDESSAPVLPLARDTIEVRSLSNPESLPIEEWYLEYVLTEGVVSPYTNSAVGPEVLPAIRADIKDVEGNTVLYYVADGDRVFVISHHSVQPEFRLEYGNLFSDMLFSFDPLRDGVRPEAAPSSEDASTPSSDSTDVMDASNGADASGAIDATPPPAMTTIPEGYRSMESASLDFRMVYPARWYYTRSENFFYFSDEPAEASNALVSLELVSTPVAAYREDLEAVPRTVWVPRNDSSSFRLQASSEFLETLRTMAKSITSTNP